MITTRSKSAMSFRDCRRSHESFPPVRDQLRNCDVENDAERPLSLRPSLRSEPRRRRRRRAPYDTADASHPAPRANPGAPSAPSARWLI